MLKFNHEVGIILPVEQIEFPRSQVIQSYKWQSWGNQPGPTGARARWNLLQGLLSREGVKRQGVLVSGCLRTQGSKKSRALV